MTASISMTQRMWELQGYWRIQKYFVSCALYYIMPFAKMIGPVKRNRTV